MSNFKHITHDFNVAVSDKSGLEDVLSCFLHTVVLHRTLDDAVAVTECDFPSLPSACYCRIEHPTITRVVCDQVKTVAAKIAARASPGLYTLDMVLLPRAAAEAQPPLMAWANSLFSTEVKAPPLEMWTLRVHTRDTKRNDADLEHNLPSMMAFLSARASEEITSHNLEARPAERYELTLSLGATQLLPPGAGGTLLVKM